MDAWTQELEECEGEEADNADENIEVEDKESKLD